MCFKFCSKICDTGFFNIINEVCDIMDGVPNSYLEEKVEILEKEKSDLARKVRGIFLILFNHHY